MRKAKAAVDALLGDIHQKSQEAASSGLLDREKYVIPPHLHDLQEADLPETQCGFVMNEIAQFREREEMRDVREAMPSIIASTASVTGPKVREWGKLQLQSTPGAGGARGFSQGPQGTASWSGS